MILEYHSFSEEPIDYIYNRTFKQFIKDVSLHLDDTFTMDDGHIGQIKVCRFLKSIGIRAVVSIATSLIEKEEKYMTWEDVKEISKYHFISNHTVNHIPLNTLSEKEIRQEITEASFIIEGRTGAKPIYFTPPYNELTPEIEKIITEYNYLIVKGRYTVTKDTIL